MTLTSLVLALLLAVLAVIAGVAVTQYRAQSGVYRPHTTRQPARRTTDKPLGYEAIDMNVVRKTNRRNEALERGQTNWTRGPAGSTDFGADTDVDAISDDETYAARYYAAFQKNKKDT